MPKKRQRFLIIGTISSSFSVMIVLSRRSHCHHCHRFAHNNIYLTYIYSQCHGYFHFVRRFAFLFYFPIFLAIALYCYCHENIAYVPWHVQNRYGARAWGVGGRRQWDKQKEYRACKQASLYVCANVYVHKNIHTVIWWN